MTQNGFSLSDPVTKLASVGSKRAEAFESLGIKSIRDLLFYFPHRHLNRLTDINSSQVKKYVANDYDGEVTLWGIVISKELISYSKKKVFKVAFKDSNGSFECVWFQSINFFKDKFNTGESYAISGKPTLTRYNHLQFAHPEFDKISQDETASYKSDGKILPVYSLPAALKKKNIGDIGLRNMMYEAVENYTSLLDESLPVNLVKANRLLPFPEAIRNMHFPENQEMLKQAIRRLKYDELFFFEVLIALKKSKIKKEIAGTVYRVDKNIINRFIESLPFELTDSQLEVLSEIRKDLESKHPLNRLVQGDVGSGKTMVALITMLIVVKNGYQAALMAPTEILANQHYITLTKLLNQFDVNVTLLTGGLSGSEKKQGNEDVKSNNADIVIGTHALIESGVEFSNLGLVVIDEQHRFGVAQRARLIDKTKFTDTLIMTATPIPRTLSMSFYGDLDVSVIDKPPANRKPVRTVLRGESSLDNIYKFIIEKAGEGYQSYIVFPLVEESEKIELKAAMTHYEELSKNQLKSLRVGLLHGKMKWNEKEERMKKFANREYDVLISTTVIEVGIDVPGANIILINDANRFGLSQLHQLRGRVGRGAEQAYCVLVTKDEYTILHKKMTFDFNYLSPKQIEKNKAILRLNAMVKFTSGFDLSEIDLKLRGPGDMFSTKQSGMPEFRFANLAEDTALLVKAREDAFSVVNDDHKLKSSENKSIRKKLTESYQKNMEYAGIG